MLVVIYFYFYLRFPCIPNNCWLIVIRLQNFRKFLKVIFRFRLSEETFCLIKLKFIYSGVFNLRSPPTSYPDQIRPNQNESERIRTNPNESTKSDKIRLNLSLYDQIRPNSIISDRIWRNPTVGFGHGSFWEKTWFKLCNIGTV